MEWSLTQNKLLAFHRLMRTDKPIGALLLLWPTLWALWVATPGVPQLWILAVFVAGVWLMRAAGCVVNDYADRKFDGHVKRTANRPLPSGAVTEKEARALFVVLVLISFLLVLTLNTMTILLSIAALALKLGAAEVWALGELAADVRFTGAIDVVAAQATLNDACTRVYAGGTVVCMGVPSGPREIPLPMMQRFERDLLNSGMYIPEDFDAVIEWLADGRFDTSELVTDLFAIEDAAAAFERAQQNDSIKVMLQFAPE